MITQLGDAFQLIKDIPDQSIGLILTDPLYDEKRIGELMIEMFMGIH